MQIVVTSPSFSKNEILQKEILKYFPNAKLNLDGTRFKKTELIDYIADANAIIVGLDDIDKEILDNCKNLKIVAKYGVGLDNIDVDGCKEKNIAIGWSGGVNRLAVAEMTLGLMFALIKNLFLTSNQLKNGIWNKSGGFNLSGKTIGIIGVGFIGKELIKLLKPFNCKILVNDIINQNEYYKANNLIESSKENIFKGADIITIHTPLTKETKYLINKKNISLIKKSSFIINTARGAIVNQNDLKDALQNHLIAGSALDVYEIEPPIDKEFLKLENLISTPHIGGNSKEAIELMGFSAIKHLKEFFKIEDK